MIFTRKRGSKNKKYQRDSEFSKNRLTSLRLIAFSLAAFSVGTAQANPTVPQDVVAINGGIKGGQDNGNPDGQTHVGWSTSGSDVDFYRIRWGSPAREEYVCRDGGELRPWVLNKCRGSGGTAFDGNADRISFSIASNQVGDVQINAARRNGSGYVHSGFSAKTNVSSGIPTNVRLTRSGNQLFVTWDADEQTAAEEVVRYALWTRPAAFERNNGVYSGPLGDATERTINLPENHQDRPFAVRIRAEYQNLGATEISDWVTESSVVDTGPVASLAGDLSDQCRPDNDPTVENVFDRIGAQEEYPEERMPLEAHVWFFPTEGDGGVDPAFVGDPDGSANFGHGHLLTCVPHHGLGAESAITSKDMRLDLEIQAHLQGGRKLDGTPLYPATGVEVRIEDIEIRGVNGSGRDILVDRIMLGTPFSCILGDPCVHRENIVVNLVDSSRNGVNPADDGFKSDGLKQLRIAARHNIYVSDENNEYEFAGQMRAILRNQILLDIDELQDTSLYPNAFIPFITESSGWLIEDTKGAGGYASVGVLKYQLNGPLDKKLDDSTKGKMPIAPISKADIDEHTRLSFALRVEADSCKRLCVEEFMPLSYLRVFVNPTFHAQEHGGGHDQTVACPPTPTEDNGNTPSAPCVRNKTDLRLMNRGSSERYFVTEHVYLQGLPAGEHTIVFAVEQPMIDEDGTLGLDEKFLSTLTGLLLVRFEITD